MLESKATTRRLDMHQIYFNADLSKILENEKKKENVDVNESQKTI